jgi:site-specific recombinase XerD
MEITLHSAIDLFLEARQAQRYSPRTLLDYQNTYRRFSAWLGCDPLIHEIGADLIRAFMASTGDVSKKTALNYHIGLSSLWQWLTENGHTPVNVVRLVKPPRPEQREIYPYSRQDVLAILEAARESRTATRDRAIVLLLLDTGMRSSELCGLHGRDLSLPGRRLLVMGKGDKERALIFSERTAAALADYVNVGQRPSAPVFRSEHGHQLTRDALRLILSRLGNRAGVLRSSAHRFRHTFALEFLRNGGNIYALQRILGHTTLDMVRRYLAIVQADIEGQMQIASPVEVWQL